MIFLKIVAPYGKWELSWQKLVFWPF